jgi:hypothetical protein
VRAASGPEPIREPKEIFLVDRAQHRSRGPLDDLVLKGGDRDRALPTIRLGYVNPPRRQCPIRSPMAVVKNATLPSPRRERSPAIGAKPPSPEPLKPKPELSGLLERAANAAKQMRYFGLVVQRSSFSELVPSATRAGFALFNEVTKRTKPSFSGPQANPTLPLTCHSSIRTEFR